MPSAASNGTTSVGTRAHEAGMNLSTWTWAGWVKRTGAGESDFRLYNKASGTAIGSPNITGQGGALTRLRGRHSAGGGGGFDLAITNDGAIPQDQWVCLFVVAGAGGTPSIKIYRYDGVSAVVEQTYSSTNNSGAALSFNADPLTVFNTTDGSQCYAGKAAHWIMTPDVWDVPTMLSFATGTIPAGLTDHYWPFQSNGNDAGEVGGWDFTLSNVAFDGTDSPPVTYGGGADLSDTITDTATAADTVTASLTVARTVADAATATDLGEQYTLDVHETITDAATASDTAGRAAALSRGLVDDAAATDGAQSDLGYRRTLGDAATGADQVVRGATYERTVADSATATDSAGSDQVDEAVITDAASGSDLVVVTLTAHRALTDNATAADQTNTVKVVARMVTDAAAASDQVGDQEVAIPPTGHRTLTLVARDRGLDAVVTSRSLVALEE